MRSVCRLVSCFSCSPMRRSWQAKADLVVVYWAKTVACGITSASGNAMTMAAEVGVTDTSARANKGTQFVRHLKNMFVLARVIATGAKNRDESRGAHFKPEFPERDDENFLKTTMASWSSDGPRFSWEPVDVSIIKPRPRRYDVDKSASEPKAA